MTASPHGSSCEGKTKISDSRWKLLLDHFNKREFILTNDNFEFPDLLGAAYEYLIKQFADKANKKAGEFYTPRPVVNLMMRLQAEMGLAFLFISHDIAVVERVSHRVAVMYLGEIVEIGPRAAIMENPQHPYTKRLMAAVPVPEAGRRRLRRGLSTTEIPSPVHQANYMPAPRLYREIGPGHVVQAFDA